MYQAQQQAGPQPGADPNCQGGNCGGNGSCNTGKDDIQDADFEEVK